MEAVLPTARQIVASDPRFSGVTVKVDKDGRGPCLWFQGDVQDESEERALAKLVEQRLGSINASYIIFYSQPSN